MTSTWIFLGVLVVAVAAVITIRRCSPRITDAESKQRLAEAKRRVMRFPPRWGLSVAGPVAGVALASQAWVVAGAALIVSVGLYVMTEQHRRRVLRDLGFTVGAWGTLQMPASERA